MSDNQFHILVIDDNEDILGMIKAMLEMKNYIVSTRESTKDIEPFIELIKPNLILMDMLLSGADGREVCKRIKMNTSISNIPIIMISALPDAKPGCMAAGANYFLAKPFEMADLLVTLENGLIAYI